MSEVYGFLCSLYGIVYGIVFFFYFIITSNSMFSTRRSSINVHETVSCELFVLEMFISQLGNINKIGSNTFV